MTQIFSFVFGLVVGSFANVCIYRMPLGLSVVSPRSFCTRCGSGVKAYDNIPLLSFLWLRGRCRSCGAPFGWRYPVVEFITGIAAWWIFREHGVTVHGIYYFVMTVALLIVSVIDLDHRIIPNSISIPGIWIGLLLAAVTTWLGMTWAVNLKEAVVGAAFGGGLLWGVGRLYEAITGREGIGFGDVKLLAFFGAHAGVSAVVTSVFLGSFAGSIVGLTLMVLRKAGRRYPIPFGPFLCLGLLCYALSGDRWLYKLMGF